MFVHYQAILNLNKYLHRNSCNLSFANNQKGKMQSDIETKSVLNPVSHFCADSSLPFNCSPFEIVTPKFRSCYLSQNILGRSLFEYNSPNNIVKNEKKSDYLKSLPEINSKQIKANFLPSFGRYKNVGTSYIKDRKTGSEIKAVVKKDKIGSYISFKLFVGKKEVGFLDMDSASVVPEVDFIVTEQTNAFPKVLHLRTLEGEKYRGIGTELIKIAIQESYNCGKKGNLWLEAKEGYAEGLSDYRSGENPIPFYYKCGFYSPIEKVDKQIREKLSDKDFRNLPEYELLILDSNARDNWLNELSENPILQSKF